MYWYTICQWELGKRIVCNSTNTAHVDSPVRSAQSDKHSVTSTLFSSRLKAETLPLNMNSNESGSAFTPVGNLFFPSGSISEREAYKWPSFSPPAMWHIWKSYPNNYSASGCAADRATNNVPGPYPWPVYPYTSQDYANALFQHSGYSQFLGFSPCPEDEKPSQSYIGLIGQAILSSPEKKLILSEIYNYIQTQYPYFRKRGTGWRNSVRHNLSLNDCFVKTGRSPNGKGHFWAISPLYYDDFARGVIRRRTSRRAAKSSRSRVSEEIKEIIAVPKEESKTAAAEKEDETKQSSHAFKEDNRGKVKEETVNVKIEQPSLEHFAQMEKPKAYDVESLLAPERVGKDSSWSCSLYPTIPLDEQATVSSTREFLPPPYCFPYSTIFSSRYLY